MAPPHPVRGTCRRSRLAPPAECLEQLLLKLSRQLESHTAGGFDRPAHLVEVVLAAVAEDEMFLEALAVVRNQGVVEVRRDQLHDVLACQLSVQPHRMYSSSALRTFALAR